MLLPIPIYLPPRTIEVEKVVEKVKIVRVKAHDCSDEPEHWEEVSEEDAELEFECQGLG